jgi:hypothetical protein
MPLITSDPAAGVNSDSRLEVFARDADNALYQTSQLSLVIPSILGLNGHH